jgi:ATP-dependent DNA helicase RecG
MMDTAPVEPTLADLLEQPEGQQLAFVRGKFRPEDLAETLAALANAQGGTVVVGGGRGRGKGRAAERPSEGLDDLDAARDAALDAALLCTPPLVIPLPAVVRHGGASLLLISIPPGLPHVYSVHGKYLRREGPADQPIPPDALRKLLLERGEISWERLIPAGTTLDELDPNKIAAYVRRIGPAAEGDALAFLFRRGCLTRTDDRR